MFPFVVFKYSAMELHSDTISLYTQREIQLKEEKKVAKIKIHIIMNLSDWTWTKKLKNVPPNPLLKSEYSMV